MSLSTQYLWQIIQPQDNTNALALDERNINVSNFELQNARTVAQPGGTLCTHEDVLYNTLTFALAKDALTNHSP